MATPHQIPQAVLDKFRDTPIKVQAIALSERMSFDIDGEVLCVEDVWYLGMISVVAVTAESDRDQAPQFAFVQLSIVDKDSPTRILTEELSKYSDHGVKSCKLTVSSDILNEQIFEGSGYLPVALNVQIEFDDERYTSSTIDALLVNDRSTTKYVLRKMGGEVPTSYLSLLPLCFPWYGISFPLGGISITTVCSSGCIFAICGCIIGGAGACLGWQPCVCGYRIFGIFIPVRPFIIIFLILVGIITALVLLGN